MFSGVSIHLDKVRFHKKYCAGAVFESRVRDMLNPWARFVKIVGASS